MVWKKARLQKTHDDIANTVCIFTRTRGTQAIVTSTRCMYSERLTVQSSFQETNHLKMETLKPERDRQISKMGIGGEGVRSPKGRRWCDGEISIIKTSVVFLLDGCINS
jgi:hypothetical protein